MENDRYVIGDQEYTREQLISYGEARYPKFYWIPRGIGIALMVSGLFVSGSYAIMGLAVSNEEYWGDSGMNLYIFALIMFVIIFGGGCIPFGLSFRKQTDENYIIHAVKCLERQYRNTQARENRLEQKHERIEVKTQDKNVDRLLKYKQLLDEGIITQEEFDKKKQELL